MFQSVLDLLQRFKSSKFVSDIPQFEESWLNEFISSMGKKAEALFLDPEEMLLGENFMTELLEFLKVFLNFQLQRYKNKSIKMLT